ncbi:MAG: DsrE family protein [marine benthic group bacterium]|jgi:predicted peroxiredoxin|nr:DsrE family protein [Gemmatimonadota bacterium]
MRAVLAALALTLALPLAANAQDEKVVVHIGQYSNDAHSVAMGMGLATMLQKAGADVTVFLDREGVRLADSQHPTLIYVDTDVAKQVEEFLAAGGEFLVCPHCAELAGVGPDHLRDGFRMGSPESITSLFMEADKVVDY